MADLEIKITTTAVPELNEAVKSHEALRARLPVIEAAGKDTTAYTAALKNLDAALSTESALTIAEARDTRLAAGTNHFAVSAGNGYCESALSNHAQCAPVQPVLTLL